MPENPGTERVQEIQSRNRLRSSTGIVYADIAWLLEENERLTKLAHDKHLKHLEAVSTNARYSMSLTTANAEVARLSADLDAAKRQAIAWEDFGEHAAHCRECGETSWSNCDEGPRLHLAAAVDVSDLEDLLKMAEAAATWAPTFDCEGGMIEYVVHLPTPVSNSAMIDFADRRATI